MGHCNLEIYPPPLQNTATCTKYRPKGATAAASRPMAAGTPRKYREQESRPRAAGVVRRYSESSAGRTFAERLPQEIDIDMDINEFRQVLREVLAEELGVGDPRLGRRWEGGELVLAPGDSNTQEKRVPIESFFHKIVMVRDKLRVLEQKVNGHKGLSDEEKIQMQSYITACYGSLTTFNILFADRGDSFSNKD